MSRGCEIWCHRVGLAGRESHKIAKSDANLGHSSSAHRNLRQEVDDGRHAGAAADRAPTTRALAPKSRRMASVRGGGIAHPRFAEQKLRELNQRVWRT
jgi:hypothetical protein